jgi:hypothetical protein
MRRENVAAFGRGRITQRANSIFKPTTRDLPATEVVTGTLFIDALATKSCYEEYYLGVENSNVMWACGSQPKINKFNGTSTLRRTDISMHDSVTRLAYGRANSPKIYAIRRACMYVGWIT